MPCLSASMEAEQEKRCLVPSLSQTSMGWLIMASRPKLRTLMAPSLYHVPAVQSSMTRGRRENSEMSQKRRHAGHL
jgi:hypothetical protein